METDKPCQQEFCLNFVLNVRFSHETTPWHSHLQTMTCFLSTFLTESMLNLRHRKCTDAWASPKRSVAHYDKLFLPMIGWTCKRVTFWEYRFEPSVSFVVGWSSLEDNAMLSIALDGWVNIFIDCCSVIRGSYAHSGHDS